MKAYYADCDQFCNHRTGYHFSADDAINAFWDVAIFSDSEKKRIRVYTIEEEIGAEEIVAAWLLQRSGIVSPALSGMRADVELEAEDGYITYRCNGDECWGVLLDDISQEEAEEIVRTGLIIN